ncbi:hypothetical protein PTE30175_01418 [Pandoraea terrae]|uniref:Uncharacterized protein n=1 Tax=Pandoraea terrae TaxID=1537710 RepID=A0A5E4TKN4_9BURK|nr:hypothetical protein [Pandoraea terrae]VVD88415.1 hypothetical protein PTE30175_01418 [Pandoraea terrae]
MSYYHSKEESHSRALQFTSGYRLRRRTLAVTAAVLAALVYYALHGPR